jgi:hypothetical protein
LRTQGCGWDQAQKVLALLGTYRRDDRLAALERAVRHTTNAELLEDLRKSLADQSLPRRVRYWSRFTVAACHLFLGRASALSPANR